MKSYITVGTTSKEKSRDFYDAVFTAGGGKRVMEHPRGHGWTNGHLMLCVFTPYNEQDQTVGNGMMVGLYCENEDQVKGVYDKAMELGAQDEGEPGLRQPGFYGSYFRDLDGNKLCAYCLPNQT